MRVVTQFEITCMYAVHNVKQGNHNSICMSTFARAARAKARSQRIVKSNVTQTARGLAKTEMFVQNGEIQR